MGVLAARVMYVGMLLFSFGFAAVVVTAIAFSGEAWSQPFSIVGNIVGYSTPVVLLITLIRLCHGKHISCRVEFALASIASILWFITASLAWSLWSSDFCNASYSFSDDIYNPCNFAGLVAIMCFANGSLLLTFYAIVFILIARQLKHGNKDVWANPLTTAILTVSGPSHAPQADLESSNRPDARMDSTTPSHMLLNRNRNMGPDMPIAEFCRYFGLQSTVLKKLKENAL